MTEKNEKKQNIKNEVENIIKEQLSIILKKYNLSDKQTQRIIKDLLVWANLVIDIDLN